MAKFKRITVFLLAVLMLTSIIAPAVSAAGYQFPQGSSPVNVTLDGRAVLQGEAAIINSTTYVPVRSFAELMGADSISWNAKTQTATVTKNGISTYITNGALYIGANGRYFFTVAKKSASVKKAPEWISRMRPLASMKTVTG